MYGENPIAIHYRRVTLFKKPALFTPMRIDRDRLPSDYYTYDMRHSEFGRYAEEIEIGRYILCNHWGMVVLDEEIELDEHGFCEMTPKDIVYYPQYYTLDEFFVQKLYLTKKDFERVGY
jgi:hypothetical protein